MPVNVSTYSAALAVSGVRHIVRQTDGTFTAYTWMELPLLPRHARTRNTFLIVGQSNAAFANTRWGPVLSPLLVTAGGLPVTFVYAGVSSTAQSEWQPGTAHYNAAVAAARAAPGLLLGALWWQGETDAYQSQTDANFKAGFEPIAAGFMADLAIRTMPCKLENITQPGYYIAVPNAAYAWEWANNPNVWAGPDFSGITPSVDGLHPQTPAENDAVAAGWRDAIVAAGLLP